MHRHIPNFQKYKTKPLTEINHLIELHKNILKEVVQAKGFANYKVIKADLCRLSIAVDSDTKEVKTVHIVPDNDLGENEKLWGSLQHHHLLPLVHYEYLQKQNVHLFHTLEPSSTLKDVLGDKSFKNSPDAIKKIAKWMKEAAAGLQYLHESGYQHLNISSNHIIITEDSIVKIKDFQYLQCGEQRTTR